MLTPRHLNLGKRLYAVIEESGRFQPTRVINVRPFSRCPVALDQQCYVREASWFAQDTDASRTTTGAHDWSNHARSIDDFSARLKGVLVENTDAIKVIRQHDAPDTLFYVDPPYPMGSRNKFHDYRHEMTEEGMRSLLQSSNPCRAGWCSVATGAPSTSGFTAAGDPSRKRPMRTALGRVARCWGFLPDG